MPYLLEPRRTAVIPRGRPRRRRRGGAGTIRVMSTETTRALIDDFYAAIQ